MITGTVIFFVLSRLLYLFFLKETDIASNLKLIESQYMGLIAQHLREGLIMPFWDYQFSSYEGGMLVAGTALVPFYAVLGPTSFALSFYALAVSLVIFLICWRFAHQFFGQRTGYFLALLLLFAPPVYVNINVIAGGSHTDVSLFNVLVVYYFFKVFYVPSTPVSDGRRLKMRDFFLLGFWAGLGVYYCFSTAVLLLSCVMFWLMLDKKGMTGRHYAVLIISFLLGLGMIFIRLFEFRGLLAEDIFSKWPATNLLEIVPRFFGVIFHQLPSLFTLDSPAHVPAYWIFLLSFVLVSIKNKETLIRQLRFWLAPKSKPFSLDDTSKCNFILMFVGVYLLVYAFGDFNLFDEPEGLIRLRYILLLYPFLLMVIALALDYLYAWKKPSGKVIVYSALTYFIVASFLGGWNKLEFSGFQQKIQQRLTEKGYSHEMLGAVIAYRYGETEPEKALDLLNKIDKQYRPAAYMGFGYESAMMEFDNSGPVQGMIKDKEYARNFKKGLSLGRTVYKYFKGSDIDKAYLYEVAGYGACRDPERLGPNLLHYIESVSADDKSRYYKGVGVVLALQCGLSQDREFAFSKNLIPKYQLSLDEGIKEGLAYSLDILSE